MGKPQTTVCCQLPSPPTGTPTVVWADIDQIDATVWIARLVAYLGGARRGRRTESKTQRVL
jgi:hypothetical protein